MAGGKSRPERGVRRGEGFIQERPGKDGTIRYQARWPETQANGSVRFRSRTVGSLDEAEDLLRTHARSRRDGRYVPPSDLTVAVAVDQWITRGESGWSSNTVRLYRTGARNHIDPTLGSLLVRTLTPPLCQHWVDQLHRSGARPASIGVWVHILNATLDDATRMGIIERNPLDSIRRPHATRSSKPTWSFDDVRVVITALADEPLWHALYVVALSTGLRPGELRAIQWGDVSPVDQSLRVRRTITRDDDDVEMIGDSTKTRRDRGVALTSAAVEALARWKAVQRLERIAAPRWADLDLVFTTATGDWVPRHRWVARHRRLIEQTGVRVITLHQLRHTMATLAMQSGTHPKIVSDQLGHANITTTLDRYSHVDPDLHKRAAEALSERMFGPFDATTPGRNGAS